jgi:hypothetical protein
VKSDLENVEMVCYGKVEEYDLFWRCSWGGTERVCSAAIFEWVIVNMMLNSMRIGDDLWESGQGIK